MIRLIPGAVLLLSSAAMACEPEPISDPVPEPTPALIRVPGPIGMTCQDSGEEPYVWRCLADEGTRLICVESFATCIPDIGEEERARTAAFEAMMRRTN